MDAADRINELMLLEEMSRPQLAKKTDMKKERWQNVLKRTAKLNQEDLEALYKVFPEYQVWLATGMEFPDKGQISPMTKRSQRANG